MKKAGRGGDLQFYFSGFLQSLQVNFIWFIILSGKYIGKGINHWLKIQLGELRNLHILKKVQVYKMSWVGCLRHQAYGDNFCHWLFYKTCSTRSIHYHSFQM